MSEISTEKPGRLIPAAELTDGQAAAAIVAAARAYDYENRPRAGNWGSVPAAQVLRIITGALGAMEFEPSPELAALRDGVAALAGLLEISAAASRPSRKSDIEDQLAAELRKLLP